MYKLNNKLTTWRTPLPLAIDWDFEFYELKEIKIQEASTWMHSWYHRHFSDRR